MEVRQKADAEVKHARVLGWYLMMCAVYQVCIYCCFSFEVHPTPAELFGKGFSNTTWFEFVSPRWFVSDGGLVYWLLAAWLFSIALAMIARPVNRIVVQAYLIAELTLVVFEVFLFFFTMGLRAMFGTYSLWKDFQLLSLVAVALLFSVLPCMYGLRLMRKERPTFLKFRKTENRDLSTANS